MDSNQLHWITFILQSIGSLLMIYGFIRLAYPKTQTENEEQIKPETEEQAEEEIRKLQRELRRL